MKRYLPELLTYEGPSFDIGSSGRYQVPGAVALGRPTWVHPRDPIPADDDSVATIHAYHFLEHLSGNDAVSFLREVERVLIPERGVMNFSMPHSSSELMAHTSTTRVRGPRRLLQLPVQRRHLREFRQVALARPLRDGGRRGVLEFVRHWPAHQIGQAGAAS